MSLNGLSPLEVFTKDLDKWNKDLGKRTTEIIFHKGDEDKFRNMIFDIELRVDKKGPEATIEKSKKLNKGIYGEHIIDGDDIYWR
ncbi:624_t:CDS:2 [Racocetra persica]|uniref:624_t:CDS:1 n=1 Tax=Racocetra persica TaxID=160502 RepID=A0ACA9Q7M6_9GLOM|nr:624_t:CDS:2 [Racocetra persica]